MCLADAAKPARAMGRSRLRCNFWPTSNWSATNAKARATSGGLLEWRCKGETLHEVLNLTIREALKFFADVPRLAEKLRVLDEVSLGYLRLGQSATTLSGGEAQRMKLAAGIFSRERAL